MAPHKRKFVFLAWVLALAAAMALAGCSVGPLEPGRQALEARHRAWIDLTRASLCRDGIYVLTDKGDVLPVLVNALPLNGQVLAEARALWGSDPRFAERLDSWLAKGRIVVLVGLYARDLRDDDLVKDDRFRPSLRAGGGPKAAPAGKELLKAKFLADYFPVFNSWERVLALSFDGQWDQDPALVVDWPYGSREIGLSAPAGATP
ncbi:MAG: hypothetical protein LBP92_07660 [Deltaproteobacteria bacterium]|jgi:hypothetical protein|nr:hypothetical protein [Deltaproteobacteria bacterium]